MRVATLAIGDELLDGRAVDAHGSWLSNELDALGCDHLEHRVLPDDRDTIARAISEMSTGVDLLLCTGGLGPTPDDVSREGLAQAMGEELHEDVDAAKALCARFEASGRTPGPGNLRQALRPTSASLIDNPDGTAPGIDARVNDARIVLLPGPPHEMKAMFASMIAPSLAKEALIRGRATVQAYGLSESRAAELVGSLAERDRDPVVGFKVTDSIVQADLMGDGAARVAKEIEQAWQPYAFGGPDASLAGALGALLVERKATIVTAESCTGGLLGGALSSVPGSSSYFMGGVTTYSNECKTAMLGVPEGLLDDNGAVSEQAALIMALEAARRLGAKFALSTTGIAGPDGGTSEKPVGTVFIGLCDASGSHPIIFARCFRFPGDRDRVRDRTVKSALQMLRLHMLGEEAQLLWEHAK